MPRRRLLSVVVLGGASGEGTPTEPDPPPAPDFSDIELWSILHLAGPAFAVAIPSGTVGEDEQEMMIGVYAGLDYS